MKRSVKGLTMIELLLVVALLGILAIVGFTNWWTQQERAHDTKRKADLEKAKIALQHYNSDKGFFPPEADIYCNSEKLQPYLEKMPCEADGVSSFVYQRPSLDKFIIYTKLGFKADPAIREKGCLVGCGPDYSYNYYVEDGMLLKYDFEGVPSGDITGLAPVAPLCGTVTKYCYNNICASCCPGSRYRCDDTGKWCIPDSSCTRQ